MLSDEARNRRCVKLLLNPYKKRESNLVEGGLLAQFGDVTKKHILDIMRQTQKTKLEPDMIEEETNEGISNEAFTIGDDSGHGSTVTPTRTDSSRNNNRGPVHVVPTDSFNTELSVAKTSDLAEHTLAIAEHTSAVAAATSKIRLRSNSLF